MTFGHSRGSRSSTLVSRTQRRRRCRAPPAVAARRRTAAARSRGWPGRGRRRRPRPAATVIAGCGAVRRRVAGEQRGPGRRAQLRAPPGPAYDGTPRSSSATAGGGHRHRAVRAARPGRTPTATGETTSSLERRGGRARRRPRRRRRSRRARRPRGSARRRATCRARPPRPRPAARTWRARAPHRLRRGPRRASRSRTSRQVRWVRAVGDLARGSRVAAKPCRDTVSGVSATCSGATAATASASTSSGTPAPTSAPSSMSPLAPEEASTQPITRRPRAGAALRATRAANTPAPNPLSMLTTVTPGAHELSIASSAASPPNDAP